LFLLKSVFQNALILKRFLFPPGNGFLLGCTQHEFLQSWFIKIQQLLPATQRDAIKIDES
jgi:hypothetical protein